MIPQENGIYDLWKAANEIQIDLKGKEDMDVKNAMFKIKLAADKLREFFV